MGRLAWSQLRFRPARTAAVLASILIAATAFTLLTAASRTSQLRTTGTIAASFGPAYDILVRPAGSRTALEDRTGTVQPDFLSGIYGGITMAQYRQIQQIPGVQIAAPIAMAGYTMVLASEKVYLPAADYARSGRQLYRITTTWVSAGGTDRITQPPSYLYVTPDRINSDNNTGTSTEGLPGGSKVDVCPVPAASGSEPFGTAAQATGYCWSKADGLYGSYSDPGVPKHGAYADVVWELPMLIAAIDPDAEARLDGLNHAVTSGAYLRESARAGRASLPGSGGVDVPTVPVVVASSIGIGEQAVTEIQRLAAPSSPPSLTPAGMTRLAAAGGQTIQRSATSAQQAYQQALGNVSGRGHGLLDSIDNLWTAGPVSYRRDANASLTPVSVRNAASIWQLDAVAAGGLLAVPMDEEDSQYRQVASHLPPAQGPDATVPWAQVTGVFDPARIRSFNPLSQVPLGPYQPVTPSPRNAASRAGLHGGDLLPSLNLGGFVGQPVQLVTTLSALPALENSAHFSGDLHPSDPISAIRVRVAGITGPNALSRERINEVAQQIATSTGLDVDIVAGSSPEPVAVDLPAGRFGRPPLQLTENWVRKGVAVAILVALDKKSLVLFTLILLVCVLFVANAAIAAVRGRRRELGVLVAVGWRRSGLFATVLGELAGLGLAAGLLASAIALPASAALGLRASAPRSLLAIPVAVAVAIVGGLAPAWLAARAEPVSSLRPPVTAGRRARHPGGITALALMNLARSPGRTLVAVVSVAVGLASLTLLTAVTFTFRGVLVGSLLGDAIAVQIRGVDYIAVGAIVTLGVLAASDVLYLNIIERAAELATIRSFGWRESALSRLVVTEGAAIGITGSLIGVGLGLGATADFAGQFPAELVIVAVAAGLAGAVVTAMAALVPARLLRRIPTAALLSAE